MSRCTEPAETCHCASLDHWHGECTCPPEPFTGVLGMSLDDFADADTAIEVRVPWLDQTLFFASDARRGRSLGVPRGRVWLPDELRHAARVGLKGEALQQVATAKVMFDGTLFKIVPSAPDCP